MRDEVVAGDKWHFDKEVADTFDDMLARSIPQYELMRQLSTKLAVSFLSRLNGDTTPRILDLGTSRGEALRRIFGAADIDFLAGRGLEISDPMIEAAMKNLDEYDVHIDKWDLRNGVPAWPCDVVLSILTLQFVPMEYRLKLLRDAYQNLRSGGALILVEKVLGASGEHDALFVDRYLEIKAELGYTQEQIDRKRLSLEGVLVPMTADTNEHFLRSVGFRFIDCFWRYLNFAGWLAIKE